MTQVVALSQGLRDGIVTHLRGCLPYEGCGLLIGRDGVVTRIIGIENVARDKKHTYVMDGEALGLALLDLERRGEVWLGVFHSHIDCAPVPSARDIEDARRQTAGMIHLIVGFVGDEVRAGGWLIEADGRVDKLVIVSSELELKAHAKRHAPLTAYEGSLLVSVGLLALLVLVVIAVILLPPAPDLSLM